MTAVLVGRCRRERLAERKREVEIISHHSLDMTNRIAELNDAFRRTFVGGEVYLTLGIASLPNSGQQAIIDRVRAFNGFTPENDPYGEHDFGSFWFYREKIFWKIDCYDRDREMGSPDPADPSVTRRILTILLAEEW